MKVQNSQKLVDAYVLYGLIAFFEADFAQAQTYMKEVFALGERLGIPYSSLLDAHALQMRLYLAQGDSLAAREKLLEVLNVLPEYVLAMNFVHIACADWLIYQEDIEKAYQLLYFIRHSDVPFAVRKCAQELIDSLPEKDKEVDISDFDVAALCKAIRDELAD